MAGRGVLVAGSFVFGCRQVCFWVQAVFFLVVGGVLSATGELLPDTQRTN